MQDKGLGSKSRNLYCLKDSLESWSDFNEPIKDKGRQDDEVVKRMQGKDDKRM